MKLHDKIIDDATWAILAAVLAFAGIDKLVHYEGFVNAINDYRILPIPLGWLIAPLVIAAELAIAVGLGVKPWRTRSAIGSILLMTLLTCGWVVNRMLGSHGLCGCWFSITMARDEWHLMLNCILIALGVLTWWESRQYDEPRSPSAPPVPVEGEPSGRRHEA